MEENKDENKEENKVENKFENLEFSKPKKRRWLFWVISLLVVFLLAGIAYFVFFNREKPAAPTPAEPKKETPMAKEEPKDTGPSMPGSFKLLTPTAGETVCINPASPYKISWEVPADLEFLKLNIITAGIDSPLGQFDAVKETRSSAGYGELLWNFQSAGGYPITEKDGYRIVIAGEYKGESFKSVINGAFSLKTCQ